MKVSIILASIALIAAAPRPGGQTYDTPKGFEELTDSKVASVLTEDCDDAKVDEKAAYAVAVDCDEEKLPGDYEDEDDGEEKDYMPKNDGDEDDREDKDHMPGNDGAKGYGEEQNYTPKFGGDAIEETYEDDLEDETEAGFIGTTSPGQAEASQFSGADPTSFVGLLSVLAIFLL